MKCDRWECIDPLGVYLQLAKAVSSDHRPLEPSDQFWTPRIAALQRVSIDEVEIHSVRGHRPSLRIQSANYAVSFSRSAGARACAVRLSGQVGVDVERRVVFSDGAEMLAIAASDSELAETEKVFDQQSECLLRLWTAKEAALKLVGVGLSVAPKDAQLERIDHGGCIVTYNGMSMAVCWIDYGDHLMAVATDATNED